MIKNIQDPQKKDSSAKPAASAAPEDEIIKVLAAYMQPFAREESQLLKDFQNSHLVLAKRAESGEAISGKEYMAIDEKYNAGIADVRMRVEKAIAQNVVNTPRDMASLIRNEDSVKVAEHMMGLYTSAMRLMVQNARVDQRGYPTSVQMEALERAFAEDYIKGSKYREDTHIGRDITTERGLIAALLMKNRGIALGDEHTKDESLKLLQDNMPQFRSLGVDTIYMEQDKSYFDQLNAMSAPDLRDLAEKREKDGVTLMSPEGRALLYRVRHSDDVSRELALVLASAKENGIRLVNIDRSGAARDVASDLGRINETNFIWVENIEEDRRQLKERTGTEGKFIVFGGNHHFVNGRYDGNGMVDEALGIPVVAFERRPKNTMPEFRREHSPNGVDFYLRGGEDYHDAYRSARIADIDDVQRVLSPFATVPGVKPIQDKLSEMARQHEREYLASFDRLISADGKPSYPDSWFKPKLPDPPTMLKTPETPQIKLKDDMKR